MGRALVFAAVRFVNCPAVILKLRQPVRFTPLDQTMTRPNALGEEMTTASQPHQLSGCPAAGLGLSLLLVGWLHLAPSLGVTTDIGCGYHEPGRLSGDLGGDSVAWD